MKLVHMLALLFIPMMLACEQRAPAMALGELDSREFGAVGDPMTVSNGTALFQNDDGIVSLSMETTKGTPKSPGGNPYGKVTVRMIENSAGASSVTCKIEEPTQRGYANGPLQWVVDIYCNYTAHEAGGEDIRLTVMPDLGVQGGEQLR